MGRRTRLFVLSLLSIGVLMGAFIMPRASAHPFAPVTTLKATEQPASAQHAVLVLSDPLTTENTWVVQPGDTLSAIGKRFGQSWEVLASLNHLADPNLIMPGQLIRSAPAGYVPPAPAPTPKPTPAPTVTSAAAPTSHTLPSSGADSGGIWACIAQHESGGNSATNTGNGFYGAFQFTLSTWRAAGGGPGLPSEYGYGAQLAIAQRVQQMQGWGAWPVTSRECGA